MSTHPATRSRWLDWKPQARILADTAEGKPTKPSKPGFVGFDGADSAESFDINAETGPIEPAALKGTCSEVESNFCRIPPAEAWPESLKQLAEARAGESGDPEAARSEVWISYDEWKARDLNWLFDECGITGHGQKPSKIRAETVRHGSNRETRGNGKS